MKWHLQREIDKLKKKILSLGAMVEERVRMAIEAHAKRDGDLARKIIEADREIDALEVEMEEECLKILALYQPVAVDLRFISAIIKINNDLERIGDEAVNIAERVEIISKRPPVKVPFDFTIMAERTEAMLKGSLDAMVNLDADLAYRICLMDDEVDEIHCSIYDKIKEALHHETNNTGVLINLFLISRHLERIADHATNIAEDVIYMIEGKISRHRKNAVDSEPR
jgi:phosphate transport system protein